MLRELHAHTASPCGRVKAVDLLHFVMERGVQLAVFIELEP